MKLDGKVAVITGAAGGIGAAMARRFYAEGAQVVVSDFASPALDAVAAEVAGPAIPCDVANESEIKTLIGGAEDAYGDIDVFCSNAGIALMGGEDAPNEDWQKCWDIHLMSHVYAARALAPKMAARGSGYLVNTASAAGLLTHFDSATYSVTKHAAVAFAEWLSINYGDQGVRVSVLCPQAVRTAMTAGAEDEVAAVDGMLEPEDLADCVVASMDREDFLILPHEIVRDYVQHKAANADRWLAGMRKLKARFSVRV